MGKICKLCKIPVKPAAFSKKYFICPQHGVTSQIEEVIPPVWWWQLKDDPNCDCLSCKELRHRQKLHGELVKQNACGFMREDGFCEKTYDPNIPITYLRFVDETCYSCNYYTDPFNFQRLRYSIRKFIERAHPSIQGVLDHFDGISQEQLAKALIYLKERGEVKVDGT